MSIREKIQGIRQEVGQFTREHALLFRRAKIALELGLVLAAPASLIACNEATATEPTAPMTTPLPTDMINPLDAQATGVSTLAPVDGSTQGQQPEVPPTAAPEAVASATPPTMEQLAQGGGFNYESQEELQRNALDYLYDFFFVEQVVNEDGVPGTRFNELGGEISIFPWRGGAWGTSPQLVGAEGQGKPIAYVNFGIKGPARRTSVAGFTEQTGITADSLRFGEDGVVYAVVVHPDGSTTDVGMTSRDIVNWQVLQTAQAATETPTEEPAPAPTEMPEPTETPDPVAAEAQKVVEYVEAHGSPIHLAQIPGMRLEATEQLQQAIWNRIPKELQELGPNPLFLIIPDADRLRAVIDTLSIQVEGHENKVPLAGREVVFTFMSATEEVPDVMLPLYYGQGNGSYRIGAYEASDGSIRIVVRTSNQLSTSYSHEKYAEWELLNDAFIYGLFVLSESAKQAPDFQTDFYYDADEYDHLFSGNIQNTTTMVHPIVAKIYHHGSGRTYFDSGYVDGYRGQIPAEYQEVNR